MDIHGDLDFKEVGQLIAAALKPEGTNDFPDVVAGYAPSSIKQGRLAFFNSRVWIAVELTTVSGQEIATWVPLTNEINAYVHAQASASTTWTINHNLQGGTPVVQIYDEQNQMVIPDEVEPTTANQVVVTFNAAVTGRAVVLTGDFDGVDRNSNTQLFAFEHEQTVSSDTWVVSHGLGYQPIVRVFVPSGSGSPGTVDEEIQPQSIVHDSLMQVTITFSSPRIGRVRLI